MPIKIDKKTGRITLKTRRTMFVMEMKYGKYPVHLYYGKLSPKADAEYKCPLYSFAPYYEEYGWDIICRFMELVERDGTAYFLYDTDSKPQPEGGPSAWGAAALVSAVDEGLAGINDTGVNYDEIFFSPKFPVTYYTELRYITGYEVSGKMVDLRYILKDEGMRYDIYSPAKKINAHILLPKGKACKKVLLNGVEVSFDKVCVGGSDYVDLSCAADGKLSFEILC